MQDNSATQDIIEYSTEQEHGREKMFPFNVLTMLHITPHKTQLTPIYLYCNVSIYKCINEIVPSFLTNYFTVYNSYYQTRRNRIDQWLPKIKTEVAKRLLNYNGTNIFICLPKIKTCDSQCVIRNL